MSILFINGSPNKNGNTAELAETLMNGRAYVGIATDGKEAKTLSGKI